MNSIPHSTQILLVEDDKPLAELVRSYLSKHGFTVSISSTAAGTRSLLKRQKFSLIILDIGLPDSDSFELCACVRENSNSPIVVVTARNSNADQIEGLQVGADDYMVKPVDPELLLARINALLRRSYHSNDTDPLLRLGPLSIYRKRQEAFLNNTLMDLTTQEFNLLWVLASHAGETLNRDYLLKTLRGIGFDGLDRSIDIKISKLRRKLGDDIENPRIIKTIWGQGYLFVKPESAPI